MRTYLECVPCFVRQAVEASQWATNDVNVHEAVLRRTLSLAAEMPFDQPPPLMGQRIHSAIRELTQDPDPYREVKGHSNELALELYPRLRAMVDASDEPFEQAVRLAIAGNIIDLGCKNQITEKEVHETIDRALSTNLDTGEVKALLTAIDEAKDILYLADNAGEIVLDRLLIERMPTDRVTLVVRGRPVINDATREDAEAAGLTSIVPVIDNGCDVPGTIIEACSAEFQERFSACDLVISKGQGNYETLSSRNGKVFFLFQAKCPVIARDVGCEVGTMVICRSSPSREMPCVS